MVFSYHDDLLAQWWEEEEDDSDDDDYIIAALILGMEHERTKAKRRRSVSARQVVMKDMPSGDSHILTNKRPRTDNSTPSPEKVGQEEDGNRKSQTLDSSQPSQKKRPIRRKQGKEKTSSGGEARTYEEALRELLVVKEKERKLKEERWKVIKSLRERKLALEECRLALKGRKLGLETRELMWEKEHWIMFCDISTMEPEEKTNVLTMRAQIASQKMAFSDGASGVFGGGGRGGHHGGTSFDDGSGGDANGGDI